MSRTPGTGPVRITDLAPPSASSPAAAGGRSRRGGSTASETARAAVPRATDTRDAIERPFDDAVGDTSDAEDRGTGSGQGRHGGQGVEGSRGRRGRVGGRGERGERHRRGSRRSSTPPPEDEEAAGPPGDPEDVARAICLRLLAQRARSRSELATALTKRGVPDDAATTVLDRFTEVGLIDDTALAAALAGAAHRERGLAGRAVVQKLRQRGLAADDVELAVAGIDSDSERSRALEVARKRAPALAGLHPQVQQRRLAGLLARKGYGSEVVYDVVRTVVGEYEDES